MAQCAKIGGEKIEVEARTLRLRKGDWETLDTAYKNSGGARTYIRTLVATQVDNLRRNVAKSLGRPVEETHDLLKGNADGSAVPEQK